MEIFKDIGFLGLKKGIGASSLRQKVIAQNIANINTPGYKAIKVKFEELLMEKDFKLRGSRTHPMHLPIGKSRLEDIKPIASASTKPVQANGVNNVDIDHEMVELAKNSINWDAYIQLLSIKYRVLLESIRGR